MLRARLMVCSMPAVSTRAVAVTVPAVAPCGTCTSVSMQ